MNILALTNTYPPHVGGVARSVEAFAADYRKRGHRVLVVAPDFENAPTDEEDVVRIPAIQRFNGSDFSVRLPIPGYLTSALNRFEPEIVHSHHPFLLGDTAQRIAASWDIPLVFTHHTMYEQYTHYVPGDSLAMKRFVTDLATGYANLCDLVFAPSESIASILKERGVETPIEVVPTGVDAVQFAHGNGERIRRRLGVPRDAFLVGHLGRLAPEKNLAFLARAVVRFLRRRPEAHFLVVGVGPSEKEVRHAFRGRKLASRLHVVGKLQGQDLVDAYNAMDVFAFASYSETQGMVLTEAMAAGVPVTALDAPGTREIVHDEENGRLLPSQNTRTYTAALKWIATRNRRDLARLQCQARETAERFSMPRTAASALEAYERLVGRPVGTRKAQDHNLWESSLRLFEAEWDLWAARTHAVGSAFRITYLWKVPVLGWLSHWWQRMKRTLSRNEWSVRLLGFPRLTQTAPEAGLILIQIDGLSRNQLERALHRRRLRFLRRLLTKEGYRLHTLYSGLPSTTPAVQGELFYGVRCAVPSFSFRDHETGESVTMLDPEPAAKVQKNLGKSGRGLLDGGSAYSDVYSGGADESHFCASTMGWGHMVQSTNLFGLVLVLIAHAFTVLRVSALLAVETVLAIVDFSRGMTQGKNLWKELKFIPTRVGICVLLRELITAGACIDATRGKTVIHVNFIGYDEQAHRRGPSSAFAHWSLRGIDHAIRRIWLAAHRSASRDYQVWIYSDHGQEETRPYPVLTGKSIHSAVAAVLKTAQPANRSAVEHGVAHQRSQWIGGERLQKVLANGRRGLERPTEENVLVTAMGPIGHIYPSHGFTNAVRDSVARDLVHRAKVPLVLAAGNPNEAIAWTQRGQFRLPSGGASIIGAEHPFLWEVSRDLVQLCHHPSAGALVLSGWTPEGEALSFPRESGAHGGPGCEETCAFVISPRNPTLDHKTTDPLRPSDLRKAASGVLQPTPSVSQRQRTPRDDTIRILTYNVHSCIGMDGRLSPSRIARLIAQCDADIVALQELDIGRPETAGMDQAQQIARKLEMEYHFHPAVELQEEKYGDAVLSRFPMRLTQAAALPQCSARPNSEPRGALWVTIDIGGRELHLLNTHLGTSRRERMEQVNALLGEEWIVNSRFREPRIVCGDFNAAPRSKVYDKLCKQLRDAQLNLKSHHPKATWMSHYPVRRIDHVFCGREIEVVHVEVPRTQLARVASDHLPLLVEFRIKE